MEKTAKLIKADLDGFTGSASLYQCIPPFEERDWDDETKVKKHKFVVVSATQFAGALETYIFPADKDGEVISWGELPGSYKGGLSHARALADAGYTVKG